jgi:hypothetical protein
MKSKSRSIPLSALQRFIEVHFPDNEFSLGQCLDKNAVVVHFRVKERVGKVEISWFDIYVGNKSFFPDLHLAITTEIDRLSLQIEIDNIISGEDT